MSASRREVLLVEDDPDDVAFMQDAVKAGRGLIDLKVVRDGQAALEYLRGEGRFASRTPPALVLLDWRLPRVSGSEVLHAIRADPALKLIPVLILTTSGSARDVEEAYSLGANCFLTKPTGFDGITALVASIEEFWLAHATLPGRVTAPGRHG